MIRTIRTAVIINNRNNNYDINNNNINSNNIKNSSGSSCDNNKVNGLMINYLINENKSSYIQIS